MTAPNEARDLEPASHPAIPLDPADTVLHGCFALEPRSLRRRIRSVYPK